jgi:CheY-like chemotaxis protein
MSINKVARILLAEDDPFNRELALHILECLGYKTDAVTNGAEAVAALQQQAYDVIFMDIQMPKMNGLEATRVIRTQVPADRQPYIIALTAETDSAACQRAGMNEMMLKPARSDQLRCALQRAESQRIPYHLQA